MNERAFYAVLDEWRDRRYDWHEANCCQFAADVARCSGFEFSVPRPETADEAAAWIRRQGVRSLYHYLVKLMGRPVAPLQAKRGFIAYRKGRGLDASAIGAIDRKAIFVSDSGLIQIPLGDCACAFDPSKAVRHG